MVMSPVRRVAWFGHASGHRADGLSTYSREHVAALSARGIEVRFFAHREDGDAAPVENPVLLRASHFKTVTVPHAGSRARIARELAAFQPDVLHLSLSFSLLDCWILQHARRCGIPSVVTVHLPYAARRSARGRVLRGLYRFHARALLSADRIVALSADQKTLLDSVGCEAARIRVLPNSIDTEAFAPGPSALRRRLGAQFAVAYLGRIDPEKRVADLVEAFQRQPWGADHVLLIAGAGTQEQRIRRLAAADPRIHVLGMLCEREQCVDLLRAADVFVLPSTAEGLSLSLLEAMATGCAVIATDAGDDVAALGDAGVHIPTHPLEPALSDALRRLHDDAALRVRLGRDARARVEQRYSMRARLDELLAVYEELQPPVAAVA
jgi:glycosyltransferase involved in cell wall biosynthesis